MTQQPPNAAEVADVVAKRLAEWHKTEPGETVTVEWRDAQKPIPVISMPVSLLHYNPDTHRIRAQRTLNAAKDAALSTDPYGDEAQAYLHTLLMADPANPEQRDSTFTALLEDLDEHGQAQPGIITHQGVLINGNTRRAALRELGRDNMRVGVLPSDAGHADTQSIELSLQLRKEHKREYSFMNFLLAIEERVKDGKKPEDIQREFRIQARTLERSRWILDLVREAITRSASVGPNGNVSLRLIDFERHQGKLEELYRTWFALRKKAPDEADALREQRLLAIALDKSKTDVRLIESDFVETYIPNVLPKPGKTNDPKTVPGTSVMVKPISPKLSRLRELTDTVLQAEATRNNHGAADADAVAAAEAKIVEIDNQLDTALTKAGKSARLKKRRFAPVDRLSDAQEDIRLAVEAVNEARAGGTFDAQDLNEAVGGLKGELIRLARSVSRGDLDPSAEGLAWLVKQVD